jgi:hypothetical protein
MSDLILLSPEASTRVFSAESEIRIYPNEQVNDFSRLPRSPHAHLLKNLLSYQ